MSRFPLYPDREIHILGQGLLPPSYEPVFPTDLKLNERVRVYPPSPPWQPASTIETLELRRNPSNFPFDGRYWRLRDRSGKYPTDTLFAWKNNPGSGTPALGSGHGLDRVPVPAIFEFKPRHRKQALPDLWYSGGMFVVSTRLLEVLLDADGEAIVHKPIVMKDLDGKVFDEDHHFLDIVRNLHAVDFANSVIDYLGGVIHDGRSTGPYPIRYGSVRIRDDLDSNFHMFRQAGHWGGGTSWIISQQLKSRLEASKPKFRYLEFTPLYLGL